jgi:RNA polymerase sigma-70 factor (ECF subfamily)
MKTRILLTALVIASSLAAAPAAEPTIDSMPPVVVKTVPEAGSTGVAAGVVEIKVVFSKKMTDQSWSWSTAWEKSDAEVVAKPKYEADGKTCVLKVKLEPNRTYGYWLNSQKFKNFKDAGGRPAVPYLLTFKTAAK